jgi:hypothetical protein
MYLFDLGSHLLVHCGIGGRFHPLAEITLNIDLIFSLICECASRDHKQGDKNAFPHFKPLWRVLKMFTKYQPPLRP